MELIPPQSLLIETADYKKTNLGAGRTEIQKAVICTAHVLLFIYLEDF